jgi:DNA-binding NarL/FixJ family response regulator
VTATPKPPKPRDALERSETTATDHASMLERGRACYAARAWADAHAALRGADGERPLAAADLELLALAAGLIGRDDDMLDALERRHQLLLETGADEQAAHAAFWLGFRSLALGESARAAAWHARAQRLVDGLGCESVVHGYLLLPVVYRHAADPDTAQAVAARAIEIGERHGDRDLAAFARNMRGRALMRMGEIERGLALMDEAMLAAISGELSPTVTGLVYCSLIAGCQQVFALDRAREWTQALANWWQAQPQLVAFTGACMVHRVELMQVDGTWNEAIEEARRACSERYCASERSAAAEAFYQAGEIHRLRGELAEAEAAYADASRLGREPQPGLSLLRLAQGKSDAAARTMRRVLASTKEHWQRGRYLPAYVEVMLAAGDLAAARSGSDELAHLAQQLASEVLAALAAHARAAIHLAEGEPEAALEPLRAALGFWQRVLAPYLAARIRAQLAEAYRALGDDESARLESNAAREVFEQLGARPALDALTSPRAASRGPAAHGDPALSPREHQVLLQIARGKTNKQIARELGLSEKTIDRHVSNLFGKLNVSSRAAATAYAYEHGLI